MGFFRTGQGLYPLGDTSVPADITSRNRPREQREVEPPGYLEPFDMHCDDVDAVKLVSETLKAS